MAENDENGKSCPKLKEQFISNIKGKDFVLYSGLLDLGHQIGIKSIKIEPIQYPTKENGMEAICMAIVTSKNEQVFTEIGDASPKNVNRMIAEHILRMAATRAKARALRDMTNIGMTALEELGDLDQVIGGNNGSTPPKRQSKGKPVNVNNRKENNINETPKEPKATPKKDQKTQKPDSKKEEATEKPIRQTGISNTSPQASTAQIKAITNLGKRKGIPDEELDKMVQDAFRLPLEKLSSNEASAFIKQLQQAA
ncbi:Zinc finger SWIM domain protein (fragment) [Desulfamplus magnetovallimortis]|uniref:Zinc finger SWIM domain protein n=1 Tax=Desulfamplus magnetovallimortis TaxID=1246637 RepID=A0A1W1HE49_9BACT